MLGGTWPIACDDPLIVAELTPMSPPKLGPMPFTVDVWLLNSVVAALIEAWSVCDKRFGVTPASEAESARLSSVALRVESWE
jgi:hypothetical protein